MAFVCIAPIDESFPETIEAMDKAMNDWTDKAARGECAWICSDCCSSFPEGMPDECAHGHQKCTDIIQRDKAMARGELPPNAGVQVRPACGTSPGTTCYAETED